jgi:ribosomal protein S18 acetylase RimI-like enzyme
MWRIARSSDDDSVVNMFRVLNEEDPGEKPVEDAYMRRTLVVLRDAPARGHVVVLDVGNGPQGYALLIPFWSNELGGDVCTIDELYVAPELRGCGHATALLRSLMDGTALLPARPDVLELETSPDNARARALYESLGFRAIRNTVMRTANRSEQVK